MCTAARSVWYFILAHAFLVKISVHLVPFRRLVQLVRVSTKARVVLNVLKESRACQCSQIIHWVTEFLWGHLGLTRERREQAWKVEQDMNRTHWPLDSRESWYFIGKHKPSGSYQEANLHAAFRMERYIVATWFKKIFFSLKKKNKQTHPQNKHSKSGVLMWPFEERASYKSREQM